MRPLGVLLLLPALLAAGCAEGDDGARNGPMDATATATEASPSGGTGTASGEGPRGPAPSVPGVTHSPPPAWVATTSDGDVWLAHGGFCWETQCADPRPVEMRDDIPRIEPVAGEPLVFHLGFEPDTLTLTVGGDRHELPASDVATWEVSGTGGLLTLEAERGGHRAQYLAEVVVR